MKKKPPQLITPDPWEKLKDFTEARIALGRSGVSLPTRESLNFKLAHARARDAVHQAVETEKLTSVLESAGHSLLLLKSAADDRSEYLSRPDKGRVLCKESRRLLEKENRGFNLCIVICDGLSAPAVNESGAAVCNGLLELISQTTFTVAPVCFVTNGRVAIGDEIAQMFDAELIIMLIGERPGLTSPNSLGAYLTYRPSSTTTDDARNCISNIRTGGLSIGQAITKIAYLIEHGFKRGETGVHLKDRMTEDYTPFLTHQP